MTFSRSSRSSRRPFDLLSCFLCVVIVPLFHLSKVSAFTLITFDVDGTLVKGSGSQADSSAHARAFSYACSQVLGKGRPVKPVAEALPRQEYHGSTDGLILCRLAKAELGIDQVSEHALETMFDVMYNYIAAMEDSEISRGIAPLPGVLDQLQKLAALQQQQKQQQSLRASGVTCGLVTGNVEGIARRKMRAVGVLQTGALAAPSLEQLEPPKNRRWHGLAQDIGFLGGFGSDYCSRNVIDKSRNFLDRGEQIAIAARRAQASLQSADDGKQRLSRVVHVGDAPADVLATKAFADNELSTSSADDLCIGMVAVATGSYSAEQLREAAGTPVPGRWEPVVLEQGMADPYFLDACGI